MTALSGDPGLRGAMRALRSGTILAAAGAALVVLGACTQVVPSGPAPGTMPATAAAYGPDNAGMPAVAVSQGYQLRAGDELGIVVWNNPDLSRTIRIGPDGRIQLPLVGEVEAAGQSMSGLQRLLTDRLRAHLVDPQVSVSLQELRSYRIYVTGQVLRPGMFEVNGPVSLVQALAMAGGFTAFASRNDIVVHNPFDAAAGRREFDFRAFLRDPRRSDIVLGPGDTVIVR